MKTMKQIFVWSVVILFGMTQSLAAQEMSGREIVKEAYNRPEGDDQESNLKMTLINSRGDTRVRDIRQFMKDMDEVEKSIMFFKSPADVAGTSFMNWTYDDDQNDDQWIYLPTLSKVKRISSESKSDYFMGSDFTYDDLGDRKLDEDEHELQREEEINGKSCYVVESVPVDPDYMYSKTVTWIEKDTYIGVKKEFYDEEGEHLKTLTVKKYEDISGFDIITHSEMHNVQKDHTTKMELTEVEVNTGLDEGMFTERMMMRGI
ncbi:MAG: outer membrane lipoprotein-sorting protein [Marinilabiliaceae bacterium]